MNWLVPTKYTRLNEAVGFVLFTAAILIILSLISYHPMDPSFNVSRNAITEDVVQNFVGKFGAYTADLLLTAVGFSSFILPIVFLIFGWKWLRSREINSPIIKVVGLIGLGGSTCLLLSLFFPHYFHHYLTIGWPIKAGGVVGGLLSDWFQAQFNWTGSWIVAVMILFVSLFVSTRFSFAIVLVWIDKKFEIIRALKTRWRSWRKKVAKKKEQKRLKTKLKRRREAENASTQEISDSKKRNEVLAQGLSGDGGQSEINVVETSSRLTTGKRKVSDFIAESDFLLPSLEFLSQPGARLSVNEEELVRRASQVVEKYKEYGVLGQIDHVHPGPIVTTYEFKPEAGVKYSRIINLVDDLCLALKAESMRIARLPGKSTVGVEVPNSEREEILLREILESPEFQKSPSKITIALGKDIVGKIVVADLAKMPHLLIAGQTGAGKSVAINSMILSLLYKASPEEVKLIMVDPKRLELGVYDDIPHLLTPVVVEPKKASNALKWATKEMEDRYKLLASVGVRSIDQFNTFVRKPKNMELFANSEENPLKPLPFIVIVIDELADLMMVASKDVQDSIMRLAQMARAVGIHLIVATQRPSVDVLTGLIKANFPARISFRVAQKVDSRTILDQMGAQQLLGRGDMLFIPPSTSKLVRVHGPLVTEQEIFKTVEHLKEQGQPVYNEKILEEKIERGELEDLDQETDEMFDEAVRIVVEMGRASTSTLQRRLRIGYGRAARILDIMERDGIVGPPDGSKPRAVLKSKDYFREIDEEQLQ
jgi:S-DNA-T family DNA segregation ATPase FtsK/SpoIIIE